jgi:hypothetical protein
MHEEPEALPDVRQDAQAIGESATPEARTRSSSGSTTNDGTPDAVEINRAIDRARSTQAL